MEWTDEDNIKERNIEIFEICQDINNIKDIFDDLTLIVKSQGDGICKIDKLAEKIVQDTKKGEEFLVKANEYQKYSLSTGLIVGAIIGGPTGAILGLKLYSIITALGGSVIGGLIMR